jgi:predicted phosphodiesterase
LLLAESVEIFEQAIREIRQERPDFVLVCGDLTKDGERVSHERFELLLEEIEHDGVPVYVVPGNHDIDSPYATRFVGNHRSRAEPISASEFAQFYREYGYREALLRDPGSLSYVVEPVEGLWVVGIDSCRYGGFEQEGRGDGRIRPATIQWLREILREAAEEKKAVIGFVHHGILDHFEGQRRYAADFLVQDNRRVARFLAEHGMRIVFSGHMHAQDIVEREWSLGEESVRLIDVETGSLSSFPCPLRLIEISPDRASPEAAAILEIQTRYVTAIESRRADFCRYAYERSYRATYRAIRHRLESFWVADENAASLAEWLTLSALAHFMGDERVEEDPFKPDSLGFWGRFLARAARELLDGLWNDPEPSDNNLTILLE